MPDQPNPKPRTIYSEKMLHKSISLPPSVWEALKQEAWQKQTNVRALIRVKLGVLPKDQPHAD